MNFFLVNESSRVSSHECDIIAKAVQHQLAEASFKHGKLSKTISFLDDPKHLPKQIPTNVAFSIRDEISNGEYGRDEKNGLRVVYVFTTNAGKVLTGPQSIASRVSKQVLGYFGNPNFSLWAKHGDTLVPFDLCCACDDLTYDVVVSDVDGVAQLVTLADYVFPSWFDGVGASPYDRAKKLTRPFERSTDGFVPYLDLDPAVVGRGSEGVYDPLNFRHWAYSRITK